MLRLPAMDNNKPWPRRTSTSFAYIWICNMVDPYSQVSQPVSIICPAVSYYPLTHPASTNPDGCTSWLMSWIDIYITASWHLLRAATHIPSSRLWLRLPEGDDMQQCKYKHLRPTTHGVPADSCAPVCEDQLEAHYFFYIYNDFLQVGECLSSVWRLLAS